MVASFPLSFRPRAGSRAPLCRLLSGVALAFLLGSSCSVDSEPLFTRVEPLDPMPSGPGNLPIFPLPTGSGGGSASGAASDGVMGDAIQGLIRVDAGIVDAGPLLGDGGADPGAECQLDVECEDDTECTLDQCNGGACSRSARAAGVACGNTQRSECTQPDSCDGAGNCVVRYAPVSTPCGRGASAGCTADACDGAGVCQAVDVAEGAPCGVDGGGCGAPVCDGAGVCEPRDEPNGSACPGGSCSVGACIAGQPVGCPAALASTVPVQIDWSSTGRPNLLQGSCGSANTPDFALVFSAPSTGQYRIDASGTDDSVLVVRAGACSNGNEVACNDDLNQNNRDSRIQLSLTAEQTITIYVSEFDGGNGGAGTLRITLL